MNTGLPYNRLSAQALARPVSASALPHTTGGWSILTQGRDYGATTGRQLYARIGHEGAERFVLHQTDGAETEFLGNMALILAAPELLRALTTLLPHVKSSYGHQGMEQRRAAIETAEAAIRKAGGV